MITTINPVTARAEWLNSPARLEIEADGETWTVPCPPRRRAAALELLEDSWPVDLERVEAVADPRYDFDWARGARTVAEIDELETAERSLFLHLIDLEIEERELERLEREAEKHEAAQTELLKGELRGAGRDLAGDLTRWGQAEIVADAALDVAQGLAFTGQLLGLVNTEVAADIIYDAAVNEIERRKEA